jgi:hypothetical protein
MKINLHLPVNFTFSIFIITVIGSMFTGYIYMMSDNIVNDLDQTAFMTDIDTVQ